MEDWLFDDIAALSATSGLHEPIQSNADDVISSLPSLADCVASSDCQLPDDLPCAKRLKVDSNALTDQVEPLQQDESGFGAAIAAAYGGLAVSNGNVKLESQFPELTTVSTTVADALLAAAATNGAAIVSSGEEAMEDGSASRLQPVVVGEVKAEPAVRIQEGDGVSNTTATAATAVTISGDHAANDSVDKSDNTIAAVSSAKIKSPDGEAETKDKSGDAQDDAAATATVEKAELDKKTKPTDKNAKRKRAAKTSTTTSATTSATATVTPSTVAGTPAATTTTTAAAAHSRKNIRDILTDDKLENETLLAQQAEMERKRRLLEIQQRAHAELMAQQQLLRQQEQQLMSGGMLRGQNQFGTYGGGHSVRMQSFSVGPHVAHSYGMKGSFGSAGSGSGSVGARQGQNDDVILVESSSDGSSDEQDRKAKKFFSGGVIAISSSDDDTSSDGDSDDSDDSDEDDDILAVSSDESKPCEDPNNSGSHVNDDFNQPDTLGRVLINVGHPADDPDIFLASQLGRIVKPHQIGGIRFLYDNIVESLSSCKTTNGFGCILAHSMGLGKTLQVVSFVDVFLRSTVGRTALIIVPVNTLANWLNEFNMWIPEAADSDASAASATAAGSSADFTFAAPAGEHSSTAPSSPQANGAAPGATTTAMEESTSEHSLSGATTTTPPPPMRQPPQTGLGQEPREGEIQYRTFKVFSLGDAQKTNPSRAVVLRAWMKEGGVLLIGYEMYRIILGKKSSSSPVAATVVPNNNGAKVKRGRKASIQLSSGIGEDSDIKSTELIFEMQQILQKPDLVVCDEGHRIKNCHASISQALKNIKTKRRVVLTGYPLQNNLIEYWCMVDFVRPNFLGTKAEFCNMFERPIRNGQCVDSTSEDIRLMRYRAHVLHSLLEGFVQRRGHSVLRLSLPQKYEHVLLLRLTAVQRLLYTKFMSELQSRNSITNPIKAFSVCCKIWNHPDILYDCIRNLQSKALDDDLDLEEAKIGSRRSGPGSKKKGASKNIGSRINSIASTSNGGMNDRGHIYEQEIGFAPFRDKLEQNTISYEWAQACLKDYHPGVVENGIKLDLTLHILEQALFVGDRLLLFSQSLFTLSLIEDFLSKLTVPFSNGVKWAKNRNYFRLDGSTSSQEREKLISEFNSNNNILLFLISTRAGSLGINLVGANRVIVFDASWNPCHDTQAVCRIYRYGQTKPCHVYRFVTDNTLEKKIYDRQINKQGMSDRVVDELSPDVTLTMKEVSNLLCINEKDPPMEDLTAEADKYDDHILRYICAQMGRCLTKAPFEHESQLMDRKELKLTNKEKQLAKQSYEQDKKATVYFGRSNYYVHNRGEPWMEYDGRPVANVRPMQSTAPRASPLDVLAKQGVTFRQIQLTKEVKIPPPEGQGDPIVIAAGQQVMIISSPKGIFLRCPNNKLVQIPHPGQQSIHNNFSGALGANRVMPNVFSSSLMNFGGARTGSGAPKEAEVIDLSDDDDDEEEDDDDVIVTSSKSPNFHTSRSVIVSHGSNTYTSQNPGLLTGGMVVRSDNPLSMQQHQQQQHQQHSPAILGGSRARTQPNNFIRPLLLANGGPPLSTKTPSPQSMSPLNLGSPNSSIQIKPLPPTSSASGTSLLLGGGLGRGSTLSNAPTLPAITITPINPSTGSTASSPKFPSSSSASSNTSSATVSVLPTSPTSNASSVATGNTNAAATSPELHLSAMDYLNKALSTPSYNPFPAWGSSSSSNSAGGTGGGAGSGGKLSWGGSSGSVVQSPVADQVAFVSSIRELLLPTAPSLFPASTTLPELVTAPLSAQHLGALYPHVLDAANDAPSYHSNAGSPAAPPAAAAAAATSPATFNSM